MKKGAWAWFSGVPTHSEKIMDFYIMFGFRKLKRDFYIYNILVVATAHAQ